MVSGCIRFKRDNKKKIKTAYIVTIIILVFDK